MVFATTMVLLYSTSVLFHVFPQSRAKRVFQVLDHSAIYLLIAGTYTPFTLGVLHGKWGWILFGLVWSMAAAGILIKAIGGIRYNTASTLVYIAMGWLVVIAADTVWTLVPKWGIFWLFAGGIAYTLGAVFFLAERIRFFHFVWHLFVIAGTACHFIAVFWYAAETMIPEVQTLAMAALLAWASGLRLYFVVFAVGMAGYFGTLELPPALNVLAHPWVIGAAGFLLVMEFLADKVPGIDSVWDALHTFIRIPAGALLAAGATGDSLSALTVAAGLLGGTITAGTHFAKAGGRAIINTSPEPFSNWGASFTEDAVVAAGIWSAFHYPFVFLGALALFILLLIWLLPKLWRGIAVLWRMPRTRNIIGGETRGEEEIP